MSSKRRVRRRACQLKHAFASQDAAMGAKRAAEFAFGGDFTAYHCPWRDHWHIGHRPGAYAPRKLRSLSLVENGV